MQSEFPPEATVITNFDYGYTPQLAYYAQRHILNNLTYDIYWKNALNTAGPIGGIIWMGDPDASEVLAVLKTGALRAVQIDNLKFYVWKPERFK